MKYTEMRAYGFNIILKKYCGFPLFLPLPCHMEHGWTPMTEALASDLQTPKNLMLVYSKRRVDAWKLKSKIPVAIMGAPFIHFRRMSGIKKNKNAKGTVVFPSHSTELINSQYKIINYCNQLKKLPDEFKPITVCLHCVDINKGYDKIYRNEGFTVTTAGLELGNSLNFVRNFYDIMRNHLYATSNEIGSYTFYGVEMGLPFFILGETPIQINIENKDPNNPPIIKTTDYIFGKLATKIFSTGPIKTIGAEQKNFVLDEMGMTDCLSPIELNQLLWKTFKKEKYLIKATFPHLLSLAIHKIGLGPFVEKIYTIRQKKGS